MEAGAREEGKCPICTEPIDDRTDDLEIATATCIACARNLHVDCLQRALQFDSRCPLCRGELSTVGYLIGSLVTRPELRRLRCGSEEQFSWISAFVTEISFINTRNLAILKNLRQACNRALTGVCAPALAKSLRQGISDLKSRMERLFGEYERRTDLPDDFRRVASNIVKSLQPSLVEALRCATSLEEHAISTWQLFRRPAAAATACAQKQGDLPVKVARRRPAAAAKPAREAPRGNKRHVKEPRKTVTSAAPSSSRKRTPPATAIGAAAAKRPKATNQPRQPQRRRTPMRPKKKTSRSSSAAVSARARTASEKKQLESKKRRTCSGQKLEATGSTAKKRKQARP